MSDQSEGGQGMTLERYLDSRDSYRSTSLPDPWPYPLMLTGSEELQGTLLPIRDDIRTILRTHGLPEHRDLPYIAQKPHYPGGDRAVNLLCVFLFAGDDHTRLLGPAKDKLTELLSEKGISNMYVEIVNIDRCFRPSLFPLSPEHPLVAGFEVAKQRILQLLQSKLGLRWRVLCPFNFGRVEADAHPAVVVLVDPKTRANWAGLDSEIKSLLGHCQTQTVDVEFLPGNLGLLNGTSFVGRMKEDVLPAMGSSIGIHGDSKSGSGTLGGYVTLTQGDKILKGFLTNYHVVEPSDPQSGPHQTAVLDRFRSPIEVESFSLQDTQATLSDLNQMINNAEDRIKELCHSMRQLEETGGSPRNLPTKIDRYQSMVSQFRRHRQHVSEMPHPMGEVTAASGKAILRIMDWAFVKMHDAAIAKFFQPNRMFHVSPVTITVPRWSWRPRQACL